MSSRCLIASGVLLLVQLTTVISIDELLVLALSCGADEKFVDPMTNITWSPDDEYIGKLGTRVHIEFLTVNSKYQYLRYFDNQKSCYTLPTIPGKFYMIRGSFLYGNYDLKGYPPNFNVVLDTTVIFRVQPTRMVTELAEQHEITFKASKRSVYYCLIAIPNMGFPLISNLEMIEVKENLRPHALLLGMLNLDCGYRLRHERYPSGLLWTSGDGFSAIIANHTIKVPPSFSSKFVLETAATVNKTTDPLVTTIYGNASLEYYARLYFMELNSSVGVGDRVFDVYANGHLERKSIDPSSANDLLEVEFVVPSGTDSLNITLLATKFSRDPPIMNAMQVFQIIYPSESTVESDVKALLSIGKSFGKLHWSGDPCLPVIAVWDGLVCRLDEGPVTVIQLNLENKGLSGSIPSSINRLKNLEILRLNGNMLNGGIPDLHSLKHLNTFELQNNFVNGSIPFYFSHLPNLRKLNLRNNNLSGDIPQALVEKDDLNFTYSGNQFLNVDLRNRRKHKIYKYFIGGFFGGFLLLLFLMAGCLSFISCSHKCEHFNKSSSLNVIKSARRNPDEIRQFSLQEVIAATKCFKNQIGKGGFGAVYYGKLQDRQTVAVKVKSPDSVQGTREFNTELKLLSEFRHENLVPLLGYCTEDEHEILIYPFMHNGSLQDRLYGEASKTKALDWLTRLTIALGAARGLAFLHRFSIIHRDIKSSNILLDHSMVAKVADFGFSKHAPQEGDSISVEVRGTAGYLDPEYYLTQQLTVMSDVYSFGVLLLEIVCGREALDIERPRPEWSLVEWAKPYIESMNVKAIVDPKIESNCTPEAMWRVVETALLSIQSCGARRPYMSDIVRELEDAVIIESDATLYLNSIDTTNTSSSSSSFMMFCEDDDPSPGFSQTMEPPFPR